ncbi:hypothetical protein [Pseudomonas frederiksbergensis]|uniref:Uncharacterized protein n=1 Tax=Pseudomonas frederiksbergensis TaxID=104087 RepID=A0A423KG63_9PSED|nr:hypothetical protein [Pseudomonas frederiksbergensis]RON51806.1 hypothetical protein BK665_18245 [Pseudomonas frederiksbergensis]
MRMAEPDVQISVSAEASLVGEIRKGLLEVAFVALCCSEIYKLVQPALHITLSFDGQVEQVKGASGRLL